MYADLVIVLLATSPNLVTTKSPDGPRISTKVPAEEVLALINAQNQRPKAAVSESIRRNSLAFPQDLTVPPSSPTLSHAEVEDSEGLREDVINFRIEFLNRCQNEFNE